MNYYERDRFWQNKIVPYNRNLILSVISADILYVLIVDYSIHQGIWFEFNSFILFSLVILSLGIIAGANIFFFMMYIVDSFFNLNKREVIYKIIYYISIILPFLILMFLLIS